MSGIEVEREELNVRQRALRGRPGALRRSARIRRAVASQRAAQPEEADELEAAREKHLSL